MIGIGLIGLGEIGQAHASALAQIPECRLVAIADPASATAGKAAQLGATHHTDHRDLLANAEVDAVIVATPDHLHLQPCLDAAAAGKHILVEKPIAPTVTEGRLLSEAAEKAAVVLMVGHTLRFFPEYQWAKSEVSSGRLGTLVSVFARRTNLITQAERIGGRISVLGFLGVHDFDVMRWIVGSEPQRIFCENATSTSHGHGKEDETFTTILFENGVVGCLHTGWFVPKNHPAGFDFRLDVTGDGGIVNLDFSNAPVLRHGGEGTYQPLMTPGLVNEDRAFVQALLDGTPSPVPASDGIAAVAMVEAAETSARTGQPILFGGSI